VTPRIIEVADGVYQINLTPPMEGFEDFISAWLVTGEPACLIDVGPASTGEQLIRTLEALGILRLDYILLTHIHLDHAGAVGRLSGRFPAARVVCHPAAIPHLVDPQRLWAGSLKVLGAMADAYGPIAPLPAERLVSAEGFARDGLEALLTPGHAAHHVSFFSPAVLFAGEACGVHYCLPGGGDYLRPAAPPPFFMDAAVGSIDALIARAPGRMAVGHFGMKADGVGLLCRHREQLRFWERWIGERIGAEEAAGQAVEACLEGLLGEDPLLGAFERFPGPARERERYFLRNSIRGFLGWVFGRSGQKRPPHAGDRRQREESR
jgi:glyoxylase-like metal-dependent hydrolase (beta-lactamase superfamily II)